MSEKIRAQGKGSGDMQEERLEFVQTQMEAARNTLFSGHTECGTVQPVKVIFGVSAIFGECPPCKKRLVFRLHRTPVQDGIWTEYNDGNSSLILLD